MKKYFLGLIVLIILFIGVLSRGGGRLIDQSKPSAVSFMEKVFSAKTCNEFVSFFDGEAKIEIEKDNKNNFTTVEDCNKNLVGHFNNNSIQCREFDKNVLNLDYVEFEIKKNIPSYSDVVLCSKKSEKDAYFFLEYNKQDGIYKIKAMGGDIKEEVELAREAEETKKQEIEARKNTTNPAYLQSPELFVIDSESEISNLPAYNKSVWVEEVQNENTILVSYIILKGSENFITFAKVELYGLGYINDNCYSTEAVKFLKQLIEHKYVYLSGGYNDFPEKKSLLKRVNIWKEDIDVHIELIDRLYRDKHGEDQIEVNHAMVSLGYAFPRDNSVYMSSNGALIVPGKTDSVLWRSLESEQEVAKVAKRGFWETCK